MPDPRTTPTAMEARAQRGWEFSQLGRWVACIRLREVIVLQGTPLFGVLFAVGELSLARVGSILLFALSGMLLMSNVFCFNDWAGADLDFNDANKREGSFLNRGISKGEMLGFSIALGATSVLLCGLLSPLTALLAASILVLSTLYSHPALNLKERPVLSSFVHVLGGMLHFSLGYSVFSSDLSGGLALGAWFGIVFTAGHLNQEVRDHDGDLQSGCRTNATRFHKRPVFLVCFALFSLSYVFLYALAQTPLCPDVLELAVLLYPIHVILTWRTLRAGLSFESASRFQTSYHVMYACIGLLMAGALLS